MQSQEPLRYLPLIRRGRYAPIENWWTWQDSNLQLPLYERGFLPLNYRSNKIEGNPGGEPKPRVVFPLKIFSLRRLDIFDFVSQVPHVQCIQPALPRYHRLWYGGIRTPDWACLQEGEPEACVLFLTQFQTCILFVIPTPRFPNLQNP